MKYEQPWGVSDPNASYINGNPSTGTMGSIPPAASIENPQREIANLITDAGALVPADTDLHQLGKSIQSGKINYGVDIGVVNAMVVPLIPVPDAYYGGMRVAVRAKFAPTAATTLDAGRGARSVVTSGGAPLQGSEWRIGDIITVVFDDATSHWQLPPAPGIAMLYAPRDYYVNATTGSDSNDGLTSGKPFLTLQHAHDTFRQINLNGYSVNVHVADGNYAPVDNRPINGSGTVNYIGNVANPANCVITAGPGSNGCAFNCAGTFYTINGFKLVSTFFGGLGSCCLRAGITGTVTVFAVEFGNCTPSGTQCLADEGGYINYHGPITISGGAAYHASAVATGMLQSDLPHPPLTVTAAVNFGGAFVYAGENSICDLIYGAYTGTSNISGPRYFAYANGVVNSGGNGINYYPGTAAGSTAVGGQYV